MTISGTYIQGLHSTQVRRHTQIVLLTCRVSFVKHMMISTQVHHHTHLAVTTCRVCSGKHMMIMRQYFPQLWYVPCPLHARGLGLCIFFIALVCDLLPSDEIWRHFCLLISAPGIEISAPDDWYKYQPTGLKCHLVRWHFSVVGCTNHQVHRARFRCQN